MVDLNRLHSRQERRLQLAHGLHLSSAQIHDHRADRGHRHRTANGLFALSLARAGDKSPTLLLKIADRHGFWGTLFFSFGNRSPEMPEGFLYQPLDSAEISAPSGQVNWPMPPIIAGKVVIFASSSTSPPKISDGQTIRTSTLEVITPRPVQPTRLKTRSTWPPKSAPRPRTRSMGPVLPRPRSR